jgi:cation diffusion facilitator family transporter
VQVSLTGLFVTALFQAVIALVSGSTGLLADTIHNGADAFTAIPLWTAFVLARRPATPRYTYGYGRAEDVAGALIVLLMVLSALVAGYESVQRFFHPAPLRAVWWVMAAAIVGFAGNEGVAIFRMRIGRQIGSAALVADGQHARMDGWTSLAVLLGAVGSLLRFPLADPIIGSLITVVILFMIKDTAVTIWRRLLDAVDPELGQELARVAASIAGAQGVHAVRLRWVGHNLHAELHLTVDEDLPTWQSHQIAEQVRQTLFTTQPRLAAVLVHVDPCGHGSRASHSHMAHSQHGRTRSMNEQTGSGNAGAQAS